MPLAGSVQISKTLTEEEEEVMATATLTFDECQSAADRMFAYAVLVTQSAQSFVKCVILLRQVDSALCQLLSLITSERIERMTPQQRETLLSRLQEAYKLLAAFSRSKEAHFLVGLPLPVVPGLVRKLQDGTIDLGDRVENIILMGDYDFLALVGACTDSLGLGQGEQRAGMHG